MLCKQCGGDYIVGEGGKLECNQCGYVVGDISLLFRDNSLDEINSSQQLDDRARAELPELA